MVLSVLEREPIDTLNDQEPDPPERASAVSSEVLHGDCADILPRFKEMADLILTSPPYGDIREYGGHGFDFEPVADACVEALKPGGVLIWITSDQIVDGAYSGESMRQYMGFLDRGLQLHQPLYYHKLSGYPRGADRCLDATEYMYALSKGRPQYAAIIEDRTNVLAGKWFRGTKRSRDGNTHRVKGNNVQLVGKRDNVWSYSQGYNKCDGGFKRAYEHPAIFPFQLATDHIRTWTREDDLVIDPMCGSGTTLDAAKRLRRNSIGIDIHDEYVRLARDRVAQDLLV